jgi:hypothetical protein
LSRRALLRGLAGSAGGFALLPIMSRLTRANPPPTMRFVFIVEGNCFEPGTLLDPATMASINASARGPITGTPRWWSFSYNHKTPIITQGTAFDQTPAGGPITANGLASDTAVLFGLSSRITGGGHSALHGTLSSYRSVGGVPGGPTIDGVLASIPAVRGQTPYSAVRLGVMYSLSDRLNYGTCGFDRGKSAPLIVQPEAAYSSLFGVVGSPVEMAQFDQRGRLLDFAHQDVTAALAAFGGSSAERAKLESYIAAVEEVSARQARLMALRPSLQAVVPTPPATNPLYAHDTGTDNDPVSRFAAQLELATAALKGDLTNVVVLGSGTGGAFDMQYPSAMIAANRTITRHNLHHGSALNPSYVSTIHDITGQQVAAIAKMAAALKATADPANGGTMLDSTVIVYIGDNGEQHHSTATEFPVLLIGGSGIGLNTGGRTIFYPGLDTGGSAHRQVSNLWNTLGHLTGAAPFRLSSNTKIDFDKFGGEGPARVATGPLTELLA